MPYTIIDRFQFAVYVDLLSQEGKVGDPLFRIPQIFPGTDGVGGNSVAPLHQFLIAADAVLGEKVHGGGRPFQILDGRPPLVSGILLDFDIVLNVNEQADLPAALLGLSGGPGASGNAGGNSFFRVICAKGFEPGKPLLARRLGGNILSPLDLVSFPLQPGEQIFQAGGHRDQPVDGPAYFVIAAFVGMVVLVVGEAARIENQMVVNMPLINVGGKYKLVLATQYFFCHLHPDLMGFLWKCPL